MLKAWTAKEVFAWNGKHYQLPQREPVAAAGAGAAPAAARPGRSQLVDVGLLPRARLAVRVPQLLRRQVGRRRSWTASGSRADDNGRDRNPYRASFLQLVGVADTDEQAEEQFGQHVEYFYKKLLHRRRSTSRRPATATTRASSTSSAGRCCAVRRPARTSSRSGEGHDRARVRRRRQPGDGARPARGDREAPQRRPPHGGPAVRLDAARAGEENIDCLAARSCRTCRTLEDDELGEPVVAEEPARRR